MTGIPWKNNLRPFSIRPLKLTRNINNDIYYMTNSYRLGIKKFDWFKAGL